MARLECQAMKRCGWVLGGLAALMLAVSPAMAAGKRAGKAAGDKVKPVVPKEGKGMRGAGGAAVGEIPVDQLLTLMTKELKLSDADQAKVKEKVDALTAALATCDKENADKLAAAEADAKKARQAKDKAGAKTAMESIRSLQDARAKVKADKEGDLMSVLTADQKLAWEGYKLFYAASETFRQLALTDEQLTKLRSLCNDAAKQVVAAQDDATKAQLRSKLIADATAQVLTDDQRTKLGEKGAAKGAAKGGGGKAGGRAGGGKAAKA